MPGLLLTAVVLGLIEGATEFLPVSSTGHLIVAGRLLGLTGERGAAFEIFIQLGAILAVVWEFRRPLLRHLASARSEPASARLLGGVALAFLPAAILGLAFHHAIEERLFFEGPVAAAMIVGGFVILGVERFRPEARTHALEAVSWPQALAVGCAQVAALFPGFSRSAATIMGGLLVGMDRPVATEFSFWLAIPTLGAASLFSLVKALPRLGAADLPFFAVGLLVSFLVAALVIRAFLAYVRTRTFIPFAWYRIAFGLLIVVWLIAQR
jgi:undecaprenyl-diphosphatase